MGSYNSVDFKLICLTEPKYVSKHVSTFASLTVVNSESEEFCPLPDEKKIKLVEPLLFRKMANHCVDDHNHLRQQLPALQTTWKTYWWPNRVFAFLLVITEINIFYAYKYFISGTQQRLWRIWRPYSLQLQEHTCRGPHREWDTWEGKSSRW